MKAFPPPTKLHLLFLMNAELSLGILPFVPQDMFPIPLLRTYHIMRIGDFRYLLAR